MGDPTLGSRNRGELSGTFVEPPRGAKFVAISQHALRLGIKLGKLNKDMKSFTVPDLYRKSLLNISLPVTPNRPNPSLTVSHWSDCGSVVRLVINR